MASTPYRIAFLTDIHGNLHGLTAVLDAIRRDAPDLILVGGDFTYKFPYPRESLELLDTVDYLAVRGNTDLYVTDWATPGAWPTWLPGEALPHEHWTRAQIGDTLAARIAALPLTRTLTVAGASGGAGELLLMHGTPRDPFVGLHNAPGPDNYHPRWAMPDDVVARHLDGVTAHRPRRTYARPADSSLARRHDRQSRRGGPQLASDPGRPPRALRPPHLSSRPGMGDRTTRRSI